MITFWGISILASTIIAGYKNRSIIGWFFLGLFLGPIAAIFVLLLPKAMQTQEKTGRQYPEASLNSLKFEFEGLKREFSVLSNKFNNLGEKISALETEGVKPPVSEAQPQEAEEVVPVVEQIRVQASHREDIEMNLGKFWLNKIGIIIFSLGVAFLLSYTFAHFGPAVKIMFGYLIAIALFISGTKLERAEKYINYARVLLGGAWAIAYFTTYAMYHFEASKIINNQFLDLFFLAVVACGIIKHSLRYKSEALTAIALFIGYFTSVLGDVNNFTLISAGLLALTTLIIVYKMQWARFIFLGIILTYLTHFIWVIKQISFTRVVAGNLNVENVFFFFDAGFLSIYWLLFTAALHSVRGNRGFGLPGNLLAAANFSNFILFFFMIYPKFYFFYPMYRFNLVLCFGFAYLGMAAIMDQAKRASLFISDIVIAVSLLTLSIPLKFLPYHTTLIWFIELPFLLFIGFVFERKVYRYLGFVLSLILFLKFLLYDCQFLSDISNFWITLSWLAFLSFIGFISMAACFGLYRFFQVKNVANAPDNALQNFYSGFSAAYLAIFAWEISKPLWVALGLSFGSLLLFIFGVLLLDKYIRYYALLILTLAGIRFCFFDKYYGASELQQVFLIFGPIACAFLEYAIYWKFNPIREIPGFWFDYAHHSLESIPSEVEGQSGDERGFLYVGREPRALVREGSTKKSAVLESDVWLEKILFFAASSLLVFAIVAYAKQIWITFSLCVVMISVLIWGAKISDKHIRVYALLVLFFAAVRFSFIDTYYGLTSVLKWSLICAKLASIYAVYFIYRLLKNKSRLAGTEELLASPLFYISSFLLVLVIFKYILDMWISVSLGVVGVFLFVTGFLIKDKVFRHGGFIIFAITLARVVLVDLSGLAIIYKIISFIIVGILFLGVSFIYTKYVIEKPKQDL